jgi:hypothetical protein
VSYLNLTLSLTNPVFNNQTTTGLTVHPGLTTLIGSNFQLNQFYSTGSIPFKLVFYSDLTTEVACWSGGLNVTAPTPNPSDCLNGQSQLSLTNVILNPSNPQFNNPIYLTLTAQNLLGVNVNFNNITWTLTFNQQNPFTSSIFYPTSQAVAYGTPLTLTLNNVSSIRLSSQERIHTRSRFI